MAEDERVDMIVMGAMDNTQLTEIEIAPPSVVRSAGRNFAAALADTPQFKAFEQAHEAVTHDAAAQESIAAYQAKVESLRALLMLDAVSRIRARRTGAAAAGLSDMRFCAGLCGG